MFFVECLLKEMEDRSKEAWYYILHLASLGVLLTQEPAPVKRERDFLNKGHKTPPSAQCQRMRETNAGCLLVRYWIFPTSFASLKGLPGETMTTGIHPVLPSVLPALRSFGLNFIGMRRSPAQPIPRPAPLMSPSLGASVLSHAVIVLQQTPT